MLKFLPVIYPDESVYSYLCRIYAHGGFVWHRGFADEVLSMATEPPEYNFINPFNDNFRKLLEENIPYDTLLTQHTLFSFYARFLPKERRIRAYEYAMTNAPFLHKYLSIPNDKDNYYVRYCPKCAEEDRKTYGECYYHISHQVPQIRVCPFHYCSLIDTDRRNTKTRNNIFLPLEQVISAEMIKQPKEYDQEDINITVAKYVYEVMNEPLDLQSNISVSDYLTVRLKKRYVSPRGEQRNLTELNQDMACFYKGLQCYDITKNRLAYVFRNNSFNAYDILLIALFEEIPPKELCVYFGYTEPKHVAFDKQVRELYKQGNSICAISKSLNVNHEVIRQILLGAYDKKTVRKQYYVCPKWDWEAIDNKCCDLFGAFVRSGCKVSRATVAEYFHLKDKSLRNLSKLKKLISDYKNNR